MTALAGRFDVGIVGYGPVGQLTAALLGRAGHRVVVFERWPSLFPYPKAGHLDDEVIRIMQSVGAAEGVVAGSWPMTGYDLVDREGKVLVALDWNHDGRSGWHSDYSAYQPNLEAVLDRIVKAQPAVAVHQGWEAVAVRLHGELVEIDARRDGATLTAECGYVVGADGAGSLVRESTGITRTDYGFEADFLVVHVLPHDRDMEIDMPPAAQICDPARPVSIFCRHGSHNPRWEFMLLPGETAAAMETPEVCWRLIAPWGVTPANADLFYYKVYRFNSLVADRGRAERALLAGDAAHLMPPFLGQGLCSGMRDARNLAWKLDLVLRGVAGESLLDTYTNERRPHVEAIVRASMAAGRLICMTDPVQAAARDTQFHSGRGPGAAAAARADGGHSSARPRWCAPPARRGALRAGARGRGRARGPLRRPDRRRLDAAGHRPRAHRSPGR